jgi:hypothetical protein
MRRLPSTYGLALLILCGCGTGKISLRDASVDDDGDGDGEMDVEVGDGGTTSPVPGAMQKDTDLDGLCDRTERQFGTDPSRLDSDSDGLPDLIEIGNGFDATDQHSPAEDQVAGLIGAPGAILEFPVRVTVEGDGQALSGYFEVVPSIYADGKSAQDFFRGTMATDADPVDGVRHIEHGAARFAGVLGRTRLSFSLRFEYPADGEPVACARAYPLRYSLKSDDGESYAQRLFLLEVLPDSDPGTNSDFCLPTRCQ